MRKKILLILLIVLLLSQNVYAVGLKDVDYNTALGQAIQKMAEAGIINGYPDGTFRADDPLLRSQFIKIINKTMLYTKKTNEVSFSDVHSDDWYYNELLIAVEYNYINGYPDGSFKPDAYITREQFCKIISNVLNVQELPFSKEISDNVSEWAKPFVKKIVSSRIMLLEDGNKFRATEPITRAEVCLVLSNYIVKQIDLPDSGSSTGSTTEEQLRIELTRISSTLINSVIPELLNDTQKQVCHLINDNIQMYLDDPSHDYKSAAKQTYNLYLTLSDENKTSLENIILKYFTVGDLSELKDFFFPE